MCRVCDGEWMYNARRVKGGGFREYVDGRAAGLDPRASKEGLK